VLSAAGPAPPNGPRTPTSSSSHLRGAGKIEESSIPTSEDAGPRRRPVLIGVAGCVAQAESAELLERRPFIDFVVGPDNYLRLPELIERSGGRPSWPMNGRPIGGRFPSLIRQTEPVRLTSSIMRAATTSVHTASSLLPGAGEVPSAPHIRIEMAEWPTGATRDRSSSAKTSIPTGIRDGHAFAALLAEAGRAPD